MSEKINMKLNLVGGEGEIQYPEQPGDAIVVMYKDHIGLVWCCPRCGQATASARNAKHIYNPETRSLSPSIVHDKKLGGCGYHAILSDGVFKEC
jgi:hypothetical protein